MEARIKSKEPNENESKMEDEFRSFYALSQALIYENYQNFFRLVQAGGNLTGEDEYGGRYPLLKKFFETIINRNNLKLLAEFLPIVPPNLRNDVMQASIDFPEVRDFILAHPLRDTYCLSSAGKISDKVVEHILASDDHVLIARFDKIFPNFCAQRDARGFLPITLILTRLVKAVDRNRYKAVQECARIVRIMMRRDDVSFDDFGNSFPQLVLAIKYNLGSKVQSFLRGYNADINAVNSAGQTSLAILLENPKENLPLVVNLIICNATVQEYHQELVEHVLATENIQAMLLLRNESIHHDWFPELHDHVVKYMTSLWQKDCETSRTNLHRWLVLIKHERILQREEVVQWLQRFYQQRLRKVQQSDRFAELATCNDKQIIAALRDFLADCKAIKQNEESANNVTRFLCCRRLTAKQKDLREQFIHKTNVIHYCKIQIDDAGYWIEAIEKLYRPNSVLALSADTLFYHRQQRESKNDTSLRARKPNNRGYF